MGFSTKICEKWVDKNVGLYKEYLRDETRSYTSMYTYPHNLTYLFSYKTDNAGFIFNL